MANRASQDSTPYLSTGAASRRLGISGQTLRSYAVRGEVRPVVLPSGRLRWRTEDIERLRGVSA